MTAVYFAWSKQTVGEGRRIAGSDQYDIEHYVNSVYIARRRCLRASGGQP
jgi:hypothetical protein